MYTIDKMTRIHIIISIINDICNTYINQMYNLNNNTQK